MSDIKCCVIITGMSGSGKSTALRILEDMGFFPIDNIPPAAIPQVLDLLRSHDSATLHGVVAVTDARGGALLEGFEDVVTRLRSYIPMIKVIFLDASDDSLVRRYEQTRRRHPMGAELVLSEAIARERKTLAPIREIADLVVDTTELSIQDLRNMLLAALAMDQAQPAIIISSFGYKYGIPSDSDFVIRRSLLGKPVLCATTALSVRQRRSRPGLPVESSWYDRFHETMHRSDNIFTPSLQVYWQNTGSHRRRLHWRQTSFSSCSGVVGKTLFGERRKMLCKSQGYREGSRADVRPS